MTQVRTRVTVLAVATIATVAVAGLAHATTSVEVVAVKIPLVRPASAPTTPQRGRAADGGLPVAPIPPIMSSLIPPLFPSPTPTASPSPSDSGVTCSYRGQTIDCHNSDGWWNSTDDCYWNQVQNPPASDPLWIGVSPADVDKVGFYDRTCESDQGLGAGVLGNTVAASTMPPPGYNGVPATVNELLALQVIATLPVLGPAARTAPANTDVGLIGMPVWMWQNISLLNWLGVDLGLLGTVDVSILGQKIDWYMGDGHDVVCTKLGTPFKPGTGQFTSPDCGYVYTKANKPGTHYTITAAATWYVTWHLLGDSGSLSIIRPAPPSTLTIDELQVVNQ